LEGCLRGIADLVVVAPDEERSAVSHGLTMRSLLVLKEVKRGHFVLNGTPADCIIYSLRHLFKNPPDLVISGINHGANLGDDVIYSGTVAAAREASRHGIPSMAVSQVYDDKPIRFKEGAKFIRTFVRKMLLDGFEGEICLNVNFPIRRIRGVKITRQGCVANIPHFSVPDRSTDLNGLPVGVADGRKNEFISDYQAILGDYVSITPLQRDQTDYATAQSLIRESARLFEGV